VGYTRWHALCVFAALAGCAGSGDGLDANGRPLGEGTDGGGALSPDFASIQSHVFTAICAQCHVGANAPQGLRLDAANSYGSLVGVASSEQPGILRVKPGDAAGSYLIQKLEGRAATGARMPLGQPALPDATILVIRQWIDSGASRGTVAQAAVLRVETLSVAPTGIAVAMSQPLDAALVNGNTVTLQKVDARAADFPIVPVQISVSPVNDALIVLQPDAPLANGLYRLTLRGSGAAALANWDASVLDGDHDGVAGGDYVESFTVGDER
jgi:hypothetical protein